MATGYTHPVKDGTIADFRTFALKCARAFGALIDMRDEPMSAPIPKEIKPSTYHVEALRKALNRIGELERLTKEEKTEEAFAEFKRLHAGWVQRQADRKVEEQRYRTMLAEVEAWTPPTVDHDGLKTFMVEQLTESIRHDCGMDEFDKEPQVRSGAAWYTAALEAAYRDVTYHKTQQAEEENRASERTEWVQQLRESLQSTGAATGVRR